GIRQTGPTLVRILGLSAQSDHSPDLSGGVHARTTASFPYRKNPGTSAPHFSPLHLTAAAGTSLLKYPAIRFSMTTAWTLPISPKHSAFDFPLINIKRNKIH